MNLTLRNSVAPTHRQPSACRSRKDGSGGRQIIKFDWDINDDSSSVSTYSTDGTFGYFYSLSDAAPIKTSGFRENEITFEGKKKYAEWVFLYAPSQMDPAVKPLR